VLIGLTPATQIALCTMCSPQIFNRQGMENRLPQNVPANTHLRRFDSFAINLERHRGTPWSHSNSELSQLIPQWNRSTMYVFEAVRLRGQDTRTQNPVAARPCGFDSLLEHHLYSWREPIARSAIPASLGECDEELLAGK
jgi:hypothetical protein